MAIGTKITLEGAKLLAKALGGKQLKFTRGAFGDAIKNGSMKTPTTAERDALTALIHEKMSLPITSYQIVDDQIIVSLQVKNENVTADFRVAEIGLFAEDPDSHQEKLYGYAFEGNDGDKMHAASTDVQLEFQVELVTKICGAENVTAVLTRVYQGLTQEDLDAHINSTMPHPNWEVIKAGVGLSKSSNTLNVTAATTTKLGGVKVGKNLYMQGDSLNAEAAGDDSFDARLKRIEINQANLYILLEALNKFGVQSNLQFVEDFKTLKATNFYEADATVASKNDKFFALSSITGLRASNFCVITDGLLFNQEVTTTAVEKTDTNYLVSVNSALKEDTTHAKVYRSTVNVKDGKAYGAGWIKVDRQKASMTWRGEGTSSISQINFYAYPSLASGNSTLDGDWSLTSDGYFALD